MVGTPAYGGLAYVSYMMSFLATQKFLNEHDIEIEPCFLTNESLIPRGRNTCVAKFMADKRFTHLLFIDADVNWAAQSVLRLIEHDRDIIGALYPKKGYEWNKLLKNPQVMQILENAKNQNRDLTEAETAHIRAKLMSFVVNLDKNKPQIRDGVVSVKHIGTGFMLIKRSVFEKMSDAFPECKYDDDINVLRGDENDYLYSFFDCEIHKLSEKRHYLSEDYLFCKRWTDLGGEIFADITVPLTHTGTHSFAGNFAIAHNVRMTQTPVQQSPSPGPGLITPQNSPVSTSIAGEEKVEVAPLVRGKAPSMTITPQPIADISEAVAVAPMGSPMKSVVATPAPVKAAAPPPVSAARKPISPADVGKLKIA